MALGIAGVLLLTAATAAAQPGIGITAPPPAPPPRSETLRPDPGDDRAGHGARYHPAFIGPTARSETTEFGFSAWIAPGVPTGGPQPGGGDSRGWAALGFTFTWGGPPPRPSAGAAIR